MTLRESYPAHLSGLLEFEKLIGAQEDASTLFPDRQGGREIATLNLHGSTIKVGKEGLSAICSQAASSLMQTGSLKEMSQDLTSSQFAKSLTITLASAGLMNKLSGPLKLPP